MQHYRQCVAKNLYITTYKKDQKELLTGGFFCVILQNENWRK